MKKVLKIILDFVKLVNLIFYLSRSVIYLFILRFPICFCLGFFHQKIKKYIYFTCSKSCKFNILIKKQISSTFYFFLVLLALPILFNTKNNN